MSYIELCKQSIITSDQLIQIASKDDIAECARLLAMNIAHYQSVYGKLDLNETLEIAYAATPSEAQVNLMTKGMETLIGVLSNIVQEDVQKSH
jgi:hypothetical protein